VQGASDASGGKFRDPTFANMQFHLVGSETPNAFTTGGSHIYVYDGVFQLCESEEELAAVMAHEFAHAVDLDVQRTGMRPTPGDTLDRIAYLYVVNAFSPSLEDEADRRAFDFYARGGWDPSKFADVFARLQARGLDRPQGAPAGALAGRGATLVPGIPLQARAAAANALARNLPAASRGWRKATVADPQTFKDLRARAATAQGERSAPQNRSWLFLRAFPNCLLPTDLPDQQAAQQQLKRDITPVVSPTVIEPS
jgi:Zn-dependent protease with chaperone function